MRRKEEERVAFYAVTNLHLINALNVKITYYRHNKAILFIRVVDQISFELVDAIRKGRYFEDIIMIPFPVINNKSGLFGKIPKLRMLTHRRRMQKYHNYYLDSSAANLFFDVAVVPYFYCHAIYYLVYWEKKNSDIRVEFFEEGVGNFVSENGTFHSVTSPRPIGDKHKKRAVMIAEKAPMRRLRNNATRTMYVYNSDMVLEDEKWQVREIPSANYVEEIKKILSGVANKFNLLLLRYSTKRIFYIANHLIPGIEDSYGIAYKVIQNIIEIFDPNSLLIKPHPGVAKHIREFAKHFEPECYVDRAHHFSEALYANIKDVNASLFVLRCSTLPINIANWCMQQPYVLFTYKLFPYFSQTGDESAECIVEKLRLLYNDPSRIMVPSSFLELRLMLETCKRRMYGLSENFQDE